MSRRLRGLVDRVSGEYSATAPQAEEIKPYERPGVPSDDVKVIRARLQRPVDE